MVTAKKVRYTDVMESLLTTSNVMFVLGIGAAIFSIFNYFKKPTEDLEKQQVVSQEKDKDVDRRLNEQSSRLSEAMTLAQNHIHTVDTKVDGLGVRMGSVEVALARLSTVIEERIPRK